MSCPYTRSKILCAYTSASSPSCLRNALGSSDACCCAAESDTAWAAESESAWGPSPACLSAGPWVGSEGAAPSSRSVTASALHHDQLCIIHLLHGMEHNLGNMLYNTFWRQSDLQHQLAVAQSLKQSLIKQVCHQHHVITFVPVT